MDQRQLGELNVATATPGQMDAVLDGLADNMQTMRSAPANKDANPLTLKNIKIAILASTDPRYQPLKDAINVPGKQNKWNAVEVI